jgi:hypothetical protein
MSTKLLGVVVLIGIGLLGAVALLSAQAARPGETIQLWEYHTEATRGPAGSAGDPRGESRRGAGSSPDGTLNALGRDGWELVAVTRREIRVDDVMQTETFYAFKRPTRTVNR